MRWTKVGVYAMRVTTNFMIIRYFWKFSNVLHFSFFFFTKKMFKLGGGGGGVLSKRLTYPGVYTIVSFICEKLLYFSL